MTIEFSCPECGKPLSTTDDKAGRSAKCPGCSAPLTVPGRTSSTGESDLDETWPGHSAPPGKFPEGEDGTRSESVRTPCPVCGELVLSTAKVCRFCGEQFAKRRPAGPEGLRADLGVIWERTWEVYKNNMGLTVGMGLLVVFVNLLASLPQNVLNFVNNQVQLDPLVYFPSLLSSVALGWGVQFWMTAGYTRCMLKLAQGDVPQIAELFSGGRWFWRTMGSGIVYGLAVGLGSILCVIPGILVMLRLWPYLYFIVDEDDGVTDSLNRAFNLTQNQYALGLLLGLCFAGLHLAGFVMCFIGVLFTSPLAMLLLAMAYLALRADYRQTAREVSPNDSLA